MSNRNHTLTCDQLGVCQKRTPACLGCSHHEEADALAASVQASRDTGCCALLDSGRNERLTPFEHIAYWACVGWVAVCSVVAVCGVVGYLSTKLLAL